MKTKLEKAYEDRKKLDKLIEELEKPTTDGGILWSAYADTDGSNFEDRPDKYRWERAAEALTKHIAVRFVHTTKWTKSGYGA